MKKILRKIKNNMHKLLKQILDKRGIKKIENLTPEEREDFEKWNESLNVPEVTIEVMEEFIESQRIKIEDKLANPEIPKEQRMELLPYLSIYRALIGLIKTPRVEKEQITKYLEQLLK